ncbi:Fanconi anemia core complex-associated protein 24-like [Physella acuta]|uniref:Fanconi anemia core complex-associated protein 24-like n=1 Tax=Physella acuta TaxID=109671 RepID=UPI0027DB2FCD|nr:Fanconi anemia core complex-associated protein 24-like [Physella acuta]XP_059143451.1 Fanconi anemia core complex-associated protein 24-like [Physella acuta]XP_059143452.1 Fanconi anemia core complex-associated protein 24-like [Physella acuta]
MNCTQTTAIKVPVGHILVNSRWSRSDIASALQATIPVHTEQTTSAVDFYPSCNTGVVYISEADIIEGCAYKRKVARLRKAKNLHGIVIVEKTLTSSQYFHDIQKFCVTELGLDLIPVSNQKEAASFLIQLVCMESHLDNNPYMKPSAAHCKDPAVLTTLTSCPGLGSTRATALLEKYPSINAVCKATIQELSAVIGKASASKLYTFLHDPTQQK